MTTYRFVRQEVTTIRTNEGDAHWTSHHTSYVADQNGDWIEAEGVRNGVAFKVYRMVADCPPAFLAKIRAAA